jgi:hypothetical protein
MAVDSSKISSARFNPLSTNPLKTRDDIVHACHALFNPLLPKFSPGKARVQLDASSSNWDRAACDLEGFARPLFGLVPLVKGGGKFDHWHVYREGLKNGTDPNHAEYWGEVTDKDQRHVEATALGYALLVVPEHVYDPLDEDSKRNLANWLIQSRNTLHANNNHKFFRVLVDLGLENVGVPIDKNGTEEYLQDLDSMYIEDGWYRDGADIQDPRRLDYYNPFAWHYYGILYSVYRPNDKPRVDRWRERAGKFAKHYIHWFSENGANVPYGRSLIYRHATAAYWGMLAVVNIEALPWGVIKGLYLRNLRWWASQPIHTLDDGVLTLGYAYPNQLMTERYSSTGSPWWSMKAFAPLCLPADHPFWAAKELPMPSRAEVYTDPVAGMVFTHQPNHTVMLISGPGTQQLMRHVPEKYMKFAYSSRYGFSIESDPREFAQGAFDSMIGLSDDGRHFRVREWCEEAILAGDILFSKWKPWTDVLVESWLIPAGAWHIRVHRVSSPKELDTVEGGFASPRTDFGRDTKMEDRCQAYVSSKLGDFSGIVDLSSETCARRAQVVATHGNTNVMFPRTLVPQVLGVVKANVPTVFAAAILAGPDGQEMQRQWNIRPQIPTVDQLESIVKDNGVRVKITEAYIPSRKGNA